MTLDPLSLALGLLTGLAYPRLYELARPWFDALSAPGGVLRLERVVDRKRFDR